jgi:hypothetical protein
VYFVAGMDEVEAATYGGWLRLLSAASGYYQNVLAAANPHQATLEQRRDPSTDSFPLSMQGKGMARRMGGASYI